MQGARVQGVQSFPVAFPLAPLLTALNTLDRVLCPDSYSQLHAQLSVGVLCFVGGWCFPDGQRSAEEGSEWRDITDKGSAALRKMRARRGAELFILHL